MKIVAVTSCPTGIAHTLMAAEALKKTAEVMGHEIKVETQGSVGTRNILSDSDVAAADVVVLATDIRVDTSRFTGMPVYETPVSEAIRNTRGVLEAAVRLVPKVVASSAVRAPEALPTIAPEMSLPSIAAVKAAVRGYSLPQAKVFAGSALACGSVGEVRQLPLP